MNEWTQEEVEQTLGEVARRAAVDREFRTLALSDAARAIGHVNPKALPPDVVVQFVDNSGPRKTIPLPDPVAGISEESVDLMPGAGPSNMIFIGINFPDAGGREAQARDAERELIEAP